jgi:hypothetical protein
VIRIASAIALLVTGTAGAAGASSYDTAFVDAFAEACVPGRLSYPRTREAAIAAGWREVETTDHPELTAMLSIAAKQLEDPELEVTYEDTIYRRDIEGRPHHLVISRSSFIIGEPDDPLNPWVYVGCYLYNFDAQAPIEPDAVTTLIGNPIAQTMNQDGLLGYVWGPPCPMPRTGDTYLSFIADNSPHTSQTGFSGLVLKFETAEPDAGEEVPATYC